MPNIEVVVRQINRELVPQFEERLREQLAGQDRERLIEQVIRLTLDAHSLEEKDRRGFGEEEDRKRAARAGRVRAMGLDREGLVTFLGTHRNYDRGRLEREGFLGKNCPRKGTDMIEAGFRTLLGERLLDLAGFSLVPTRRARISSAPSGSC